MKSFPLLSRESLITLSSQKGVGQQRTRLLGLWVNLKGHSYWLFFFFQGIARKQIDVCCCYLTLEFPRYSLALLGNFWAAVITFGHVHGTGGGNRGCGGVHKDACGAPEVYWDGLREQLTMKRLILTMLCLHLCEGMLR